MLARAHEKLDQTVFTAYGWVPGLTDEEILKNLLVLNLKRSTAACVSIDLQFEHVVLSPRTAIRGFRRFAPIASSVSGINL